MATLYLHIGTHKTGTTSIQMFLLANRDALEKRGFYLPVMPKELIDFQLHRNGHFLISYPQDGDGNFESPEGEAAWRKCLDYAVGNFDKYPNVILTDEAIWDLTSRGNIGTLRNLRKISDQRGFQVKIIVYLRRQDECIDSLWAQWVKTNSMWGRMRWEEAFARADEWCTPDYHRHLEEIAGIFGRDAIVVRIYDRKKLLGGDAVRDFLSVLGLDLDEGFALPERENNLSFRGNMLEIKRILNTLPGLTPDEHMTLRTIATRCCEMNQGRPPCSFCSPEEREAILRKYAESNRLVARDYFGDENLQLFPDPKDAPPKWEPDNPYMYEDIVRFFGMAFMRQQREIENLQNHFYLKRKLKGFLHRKFKR